MRSYDIFFFSSLFFLVGIVFGSLGAGLLLSFWIALFMSASFFILYGVSKNKRQLWIACLVALVFVGVFYYRWDDARFKSARIPFEKQMYFIGKIMADPNAKDEKQEIVVKAHKLDDANILLKVNPYPRFSYGDILAISGKIREPFPEGYAEYLAKERVRGVMNSPEVEFISKQEEFSLKGFLIGIKRSVADSFYKLLPKKEAAFLTGITLGGTSGFSPEFKEAMKKSGTTHIVALSGYNIMIVGWAVFGIFSYFLSRRISFALTVLSIITFVGIAGAEASVVRAAIMGILVLIAREAGRTYSFRNAVVFTILMMAIVNPKVIVFDVGFQLSFLALLGILYLRPAIMKLFHILEESAGFLSWKDNLLTTVSAQLAVVPILISSFGAISLSSIVSNTIILPLVPVAMGVGFITAVVYHMSYYGALVISWIALILLKFKIFVIEFFAEHSIFLHLGISFFFVIAYYGALIFFILAMYKKNKREVY